VIRLTIYSRPGCHLCDEMKQVVERVVARLPAGAVAISDVDVSTDAALESTYGDEVPVLLIDGRKAAKYRLAESELQRRLER
jgi:glutaredoxin